MSKSTETFLINESVDVSLSVPSPLKRIEPCSEASGCPSAQPNVPAAPEFALESTSCEPRETFTSAAAPFTSV